MTHAKLWMAVGGAAAAGVAAFLGALPFDQLPAWAGMLATGLGAAVAVWRGPANAPSLPPSTPPKPGPID